MTIHSWSFADDHVTSGMDHMTQTLTDLLMAVFAQ